MDWPIYFKNNLHIGDTESSVGVATLWTKRELIGDHLDKSKYNLLGQLYSKKGINYIIRNILAKPFIRHLVLCGSDLSGSGQALINFFHKGLDDDNKIIGVSDAYIEKEIDREALETFRKNVEIIDLREEQDPKKVEAVITKFNKQGQFAEPATFPDPPPPKTERFPTDPAIFKIRGEKVADVWAEILKNIMRFGAVKTSHYDDDIRELLDLAAIVENEDPDNPYIPDWLLGLNKNELFKYYEQYTTDIVQEGTPYGYGNRMRNLRGKNQIEFIINRLKEEHHDLGACAVTWNVDTDLHMKGRPCILFIQALIQDELLHLTSYIRSNDMYQAWPRNAFALRKVQKEISDAVGIKMGSLVIISGSAHLYKKDWESAERVAKQEMKLRCIPDPRGNVIIAANQEKGVIELSLLSPRGELLAQMEARDSVEAMDKIQLYDWISQLGHAIDLGKQLGWADLALKYGFEFRQDNMPKLEEICGKDMSPKKDIRSGSGAMIGDVRKIEEPAASADVCGPDGVCEPASTGNVCLPDDKGNNVCA